MSNANANSVSHGGGWLGGVNEFFSSIQEWGQGASDISKGIQGIIGQGSNVEPNWTGDVIKDNEPDDSPTFRGDREDTTGNPGGDTAAPAKDTTTMIMIGIGVIALIFLMK